ncbi:hypothetical protein F5883DRAFT_194348 [Diaporthe sp. PMI_573]|nr:hypothetical protein F5883DRAFT_194348 [Diaporthaceae sp. PMI_573]
MSPNKRVVASDRGGGAEEVSHDFFWQLLRAGIPQLDDLLGLATNIPDSWPSAFFPPYLLCLFLQQGNIVMPGGDSSFLLLSSLFFCTSHASVLAFCFFVPHVQRREHHSKFGGVERRIASRQKRRLQTSHAFVFPTCVLFCLLDDYAISRCPFTFFGHVLFMHKKNC